MSPIEKNARRLVGVLAEFFPAGSNCEDLRLKFEKIANRKHATFYSCLHFAKTNRWIVADGRIYTLNPDGCWRPPPIGEELERHQFEHVLTLRAERIEKLDDLMEQARLDSPDATPEEMQAIIASINRRTAAS